VAANALGQLRLFRAVRPLVAALQDKDPFVRYNATVALGQIGYPQAVRPLILRLKDENSCIREAAAIALQQITGKNFALNQANWNKYWEDNKETFLSSCAKGLCKH